MQNPFSNLQQLMQHSNLSKWEDELQKIENAGRAFLELEHISIIDDFEELNVPDMLSLLMARTTVWADFAQAKTGYLKIAADYISGSPVSLLLFGDFSGRFGHEPLLNALQGFREIYSWFKDTEIDVENDPWPQLRKSLIRLVGKFGSMKVRGLGDWSFNAVIFQIIIFRKEVWEVFKNEERIYLPCGKRVQKVLKERFQKKGYQGLDEALKSKGNHDRYTTDSAADDILLYAVILRMAQDHHRNPLYLNAGLFDLGR